MWPEEETSVSFMLEIGTNYIHPPEVCLDSCLAISATPSAVRLPVSCRIAYRNPWPVAGPVRGGGLIFHRAPEGPGKGYRWPRRHGKPRKQSSFAITAHNIRVICHKGEIAHEYSESNSGRPWLERKGERDAKMEFWVGGVTFGFSSEGWLLS